MSGNQRRGDVFLKPQKGGIAGGHDNVNNIVSKQESMRGKLNRLAAVLKGDSMSSTVYWGAVGELEKMQKELTDSGTEVKSLIATFKKKRRDILEASGHNEFSSDEE